MSRDKPSIKLIYVIVGLLSLIGVAIVVRRTLNLIPILVDGYHQPALAANPQLQALARLDDIFAHYPVLTLVHIIPGLFFILSGFFLFGKKFRAHYPGLYRRIRLIFLLCGFVTGVTAFIMSIAMPSIGGFNQAAATVLFSLLFLFFLIKTVVKLRQQEMHAYREWLIRAYAIGLAIATIRPIIGIFFATGKLSGLTPSEFFGTAFWIGFVIHLILAEAWIARTRPVSE
jgi:hypothetical protein